MLLAPWHIIAATITAAVTALGGIGVVGVQTVDKARQQAMSSHAEAMEIGRERVSELNNRVADLELAISNGEEILDSSEGKTLDEEPREDLEEKLEDAQVVLAKHKSDLLELRTTVRELSALDITGFFWPDDVSNSSEVIIYSQEADLSELMQHVMEIGEAIQSVQVAQANWQAEQDRIAEEKAAAEAAAEAAKRMAAPRRVSPVSTLDQGNGGGSTAPSAPQPPPTAAAAAPVAPAFSVESYIAALSPNATIQWIPDLCSGYYVCGLALVTEYNPTVTIQLDANLRDIYANRVGISVLVHEAAHARQWFTYGYSTIPGFISLYEQLSGLSGVKAVEYMADCSTIAKLGYSTDTYTSICTADQLASAGSIWP